MNCFILKRAVLLIPLLFGITFITFSLTKALPGDPALSMVGDRAPAEAIERIRHKLGEDRGIFYQYKRYIVRLLDGDMGRSYYTNRKVFDDVLIKFPNTLKLAAAAMIVSVPLGIVMGFFSALRKDSLSDRLILAVSIIGFSIPVFWSGLLLMLFFGLKLKVLPPSGTGNIYYMVLPALTLSLPALATITRITRTSVLDIINMPFIRTARAKGIRGRSINTVHIMKNVLMPVVTIVGLEFGSYLNGAVLTETVFGWDGIGRFAMEGILKRDYPVIMGCLLMGTLSFVLVNFLVDIIYYYLDPRVRFDETDR